MTSLQLVLQYQETTDVYPSSGGRQISIRARLAVALHDAHPLCEAVAIVSEHHPTVCKTEGRRDLGAPDPD
jgi:hypothetical protein